MGGAMDYVEPADDSQSVEVLDEATLLPLGEAPGVMEDDPDIDHEGDHEPFPAAGYEDTFPLTPDEVPGRDTLGGV